MPQVDEPWKKGRHIHRRSHGKLQDPISDPTDKQQTYSKHTAHQI